MESKAVFFFVAQKSFGGADPHFHTAFRGSTGQISKESLYSWESYDGRGMQPK